MTRKPNAERAKHGPDHVRDVRYNNYVRCMPEDKAARRFIVKNIEAAAVRDIVETAIKKFISLQMPKLYTKLSSYISKAIYKKLVRNRAKKDRRIRMQPKSTFPRNKRTSRVCPECVQDLLSFAKSVQRQCSD